MGKMKLFSQGAALKLHGEVVVLRVKTIRLKIELEDRCLVLEKAELELAELRDAAVRYFTYKDRSEKLWIKQKQTRLTTNESYFTAKKKTEAEQQLRSLAGGEDAE